MLCYPLLSIGQPCQPLTIWIRNGVADIIGKKACPIRVALEAKLLYGGRRANSILYCSIQAALGRQKREAIGANLLRDHPAFGIGAIYNYYQIGVLATGWRNVVKMHGVFFIGLQWHGVRYCAI